MGFTLSTNRARASPGVVGRLQARLPFWRETLKASQSVLACIEQGYCVPFVSEPPAFYADNNRSALQHSQFVTDTIQDLLKSDCIEQVRTAPHCCSPLTVAEGKKLRMVLDLSRHVNEYVQYCQFKYETWSDVQQVISKGCYFITFDFKSGYHHVSLMQSQRKYFGFSFLYPGGIRRFYTFKQLPFGLSSACYIFTKLTRSLVKHWRREGLNAFIYIDDGILVFKNIGDAQKFGKSVREDIEKAGFVINEEKSHWVPSQRALWLGFTADSAVLKMFVPPNKTQQLTKLSRALLNGQTEATARNLAQFCGQVISMELAIGPLAQLMSRFSARLCADSAPFWDRAVTLDARVKAELRFWLENIDAVNGYVIGDLAGYTVTCYSDASDSGYGGYCVEHPETAVREPWAAAEATQSSTWREMTAIFRILRALQWQLESQTVRWFTDSANAVSIIRKGSRKTPLQAVAVDILQVCRQHGIVLQPVWLSRRFNLVADNLSRFSAWENRDDWALERHQFEWLDSLWGPHTCDRFASHFSAQVLAFNSLPWSPGCSGVNCFLQDWSQDNNWLSPPVSLVLRAIAHAKRQKARATLIVPYWESAIYWPILRSTSGVNGWASFVKDHRVFHAKYVPNSSVGRQVFCSNPVFKTVALRIVF